MVPCALREYIAFSSRVRVEIGSFGVFGGLERLEVGKDQRTRVCGYEGGYISVSAPE